MKRLIILLLAISFFLHGCAYPFRYDGSYKGKVIDADTKQPIEGVVVLGVWNTVTITPGGGTHDFYDAKETVTDKNGEFEISGKGLKILSNLEPMDVIIFKAGYEYLGLMPWISLKEDILLSKRIKWEGDKAIIPLKKLTMEERRKQGPPDFYVGERYDKKENITHSCLPKNIKLLPKEVNKELLEQGHKPYDLEGGQCEK
ncbi:MAG: hypothetical protein HY756_12500 [Nitrospirae bacterium]|nr:hypothetical protein [Nitrospirota bacterium]